MLSSVVDGKKKLKILDVMLLSGGTKRRPQKWLFTDTQGNLTCQDISTMSLDDLVRAILANIEASESPLVHADMLVLVAEINSD